MDNENNGDGDVATEERTDAASETKVINERPEGVLRVEDRAGFEGLTGAFRREGFPSETATIEFGEFRTATFGGSIDTLHAVSATGVNLGADVRYAWPAFPQVGVAGDVTSVQVLRQNSRTLPAGTAIVRDIDAVTAKPEVTTATELVNVPLNQVAAVETNIPNVILEQDAIETVVETDLRLAINEGLDQLVLDATDASGYQAPGSDPLLVSVRRAMTTIQASGYLPDTLIVTPTNAEALDTLRVAGTASEDYVFSAGNLAPRTLFGLNVRISKSVPAPVVVDAKAFGKLYVSPISLARFEADAGTTNRSNVRLEGHAAFGTERQAAAVRIASS